MRLLERGLRAGFSVAGVVVTTGRERQQMLRALRQVPALAAVRWLVADLDQMPGDNLWAEIRERWDDSGDGPRIGCLWGLERGTVRGGAGALRETLQP